MGGRSGRGRYEGIQPKPTTFIARQVRTGRAGQATVRRTGRHAAALGLTALVGLTSACGSTSAESTTVHGFGTRQPMSTAAAPGTAPMTQNASGAHGAGHTSSASNSTTTTTTATTPATRTRITIVTVTRTLPFRTRTQKDSTLAKGTRKVLTAGASGRERIRYRVTVIDGVQKQRQVITRIVVKTPIDRVVRVGTRTTQPTQRSSCDPNYSGACVPIASDVDCAGGSGNGPAYVRGPVHVIGVDIYGLDADGDGWGCE